MKKKHVLALLLTVCAVTGLAIFILASKVPQISGSSSSSSVGTTTTGTNTTGSTSLPPGTLQYTTSSPPTGQWLVLHMTQPVSTVSSTNTGVIPRSDSLADLNTTVIGEVCQTVGQGGGCVSWEYQQQTGWYWDASDGLLYVHYLGGQNVTLTVAGSSQG